MKRAPHLCKSNTVVSSGQSESKKTTKFTVKHLILVTNLTLLQRWYIIRKSFFMRVQRVNVWSVCDRGSICTYVCGFAHTGQQ